MYEILVRTVILLIRIASNPLIHFPIIKKKASYSFCLHVNTGCVIILQKGYQVMIKMYYKYVTSS